MSSTLARSAGLIGLATMASRLLGVAREIVLAALFGAGSGAEMDAFNVAFRVPNLLRDLFAEGALTAAFVPAFTRTLTLHGRDAAWRLGNMVINALLVVTGVLVILGILFASPITRAIAPGFADTPGKLELTTGLTRAMLPFLPTVAISVAMMGMLNSLRRFFVPWIGSGNSDSAKANSSKPRSRSAPTSPISSWVVWRWGLAEATTFIHWTWPFLSACCSFRAREVFRLRPCFSNSPRRRPNRRLDHGSMNSLKVALRFPACGTISSLRRFW